jgi:hypothetical protein
VVGPYIGGLFASVRRARKDEQHGGAAGLSQGGAGLADYRRGLILLGERSMLERPFALLRRVAVRSGVDFDRLDVCVVSFFLGFLAVLAVLISSAIIAIYGAIRSDPDKTKNDYLRLIRFFYRHRMVE